PDPRDRGRPDALEPGRIRQIHPQRIREMGPRGGRVRRAVAVKQARNPAPSADRARPEGPAHTLESCETVAVTADATSLMRVGRLLRPASIAIVGISPEPGSFSAT